MTFAVGRIILVGLTLLIFCGVAQRVLDRMHLTNKQALVVLAAMLAGSFIHIPLYTSSSLDVKINIGGALIPIILAVYVWWNAGTVKEKIRCLAGAIITATCIILMGLFFNSWNVSEFGIGLDVIYIYPLIAGVIGYLFGRSRKGAFVSAVLGITLFDIYHGVTLIMTNTPGFVHFGGAGIFDSIILSGVFAVVLAEFIGESRERLQGGPASEGRDPSVLQHLRSSDQTSMLTGKEDEADGQK